MRQHLNLFISCSAVIFAVVAGPLQAFSIDELNDRISDRSRQITNLEREIAEYEQSLVITQNQTQTLSNTVKQLDTTRKKLETQTNLTQQKISSAEYEINKQELEIAKKERGINIDLAGLSQAIRELHNSLQTNLIQIVLAGATISDTFANVEAIEKLTESIKKSLNSLREDKSSLETQVTELNLTRVKLIDLEQELRDEKTIIDNTRSEKALLLTQTRNKEADYRKLLAQKRELREEFERELTAFETQLRISIDSKNLPVAGTKILSWPLENAFVTQYFGNTEFARANAYNGKGHNGIDLRASAGTKVASAADGTVTAIGDTDQGCPGGSYGKWVLVNHRNGLSTLYAHLSLIKVASGIEVNRGDIVGYSGNTGYSTGPHLHLTVYASEGVRVSKLTKPDGTMSKCGDMPISPLNGYLNPLLYL